MGYHDHDHDVPARDPFVADALRSLPVPDRPADFLARLDDALDEVDAGRRPAQPVPLTTPIRTQEDPRGEIVPTDLTEATPGVADLDRRRHAKASRRYRALAAAASVALVVGAVALLTGDDGPTTTSVADRPTEATAPDAPPAPGTDDEGPASAGYLDGAFGAVMEWSRAVDENDKARAWELLGPRSQAYFESGSGMAWDDTFAAMSEGSHAAWHRSGHRELYESYDSAGQRQGEDRSSLESSDDEGRSVTAVLLPGEPPAVLVALEAPLPLEGFYELVEDIYPVERDGDGRWRVEAFAFGPGDTAPSFVLPGPAETKGDGSSGGPRPFELEDVQPGTEIEIAAPAGGDLLLVSDNLAVTELGGNTHNIGTAAGARDVLVATRSDGWFQAISATIFVTDDEPAACGDIGFTPNSDDLASDIEVTGGTCAEAERLVRAVHEGPDDVDVRYVEREGFACRIFYDEMAPLPVRYHTCYDEPDGNVRVTWQKT